MPNSKATRREFSDWNIVGFAHCAGASITKSLFDSTRPEASKNVSQTGFTKGSGLRQPIEQR